MEVNLLLQSWAGALVQIDDKAVPRDLYRPRWDLIGCVCVHANEMKNKDQSTESLLNSGELSIRLTAPFPSLHPLSEAEKWERWNKKGKTVEHSHSFLP